MFPKHSTRPLGSVLPHFPPEVGFQKFRDSPKALQGLWGPSGTAWATPKAFRTEAIQPNAPEGVPSGRAPMAESRLNSPLKGIRPSLKYRESLAGTYFFEWLTDVVEERFSGSSRGSTRGRGPGRHGAPVSEEQDPGRSRWTYEKAAKPRTAEAFPNQSAVPTTLRSQSPKKAKGPKARWLPFPGTKGRLGPGPNRKKKNREPSFPAGLPGNFPKPRPTPEEAWARPLGPV